MVVFCTDLDHLISPILEREGALNYYARYEAWKDKQAAVWARVKEVTKKGKQKWRLGNLLVDERCSPAVLDFLRSAHVGRAAPPVEENWTVRMKWRRRRWPKWRSKQSSDPRASGIGFHL